MMDATMRWKINAAWEKALGHDEFADDDDFFAVGGDSLRASLVVRTLERAGIRVELSTFMENPTVAGLIAACDNGVAAQQPSLRRIERRA